MENTPDKGQLRSAVPHYSLFGAGSPDVHVLSVSIVGANLMPVFSCDKLSSYSVGESFSSNSSKFVFSKILSSSSLFSIMDMLAKC